MKSKYQIKSKEGVVTFTKKDDFLKRCRLEFSTNKKGNIQYSFDYGNKWNSILNFPNDRQTIQNERKPQVETRNYSKKTESKSGWGWGTYLIIVLWIWIGLTFIDSKVKRIDFIHRINTELKNEINKNNQNKVPRTENNQETITPMGSSNDVNQVTNEYKDNSTDIDNGETIQNGETFENNVLTSIPITDESMEIYNQSDFLKSMKPTEDEKNSILAILSDPNPNPNGNNGNSCSQSNYRCTYCSGFIPSRIYTLQWRLNDILNPSAITGSSGLVYNFSARMYNEGENNSFKETLEKGYSIIRDIINEYKQGERYTCVTEPIRDGGQDFCSKKCETEYRYSH